MTGDVIHAGACLRAAREGTHLPVKHADDWNRERVGHGYEQVMLLKYWECREVLHNLSAPVVQP
jgi:hypothetical protein